MSALRLVVYQEPTRRWWWRLERIDGKGQKHLLCRSPKDFADQQHAEQHCEPLSVGFIDGPDVERYRPDANDADPRIGTRSARR